jgi:protoheme IX farnesyltransferase
MVSATLTAAPAPASAPTSVPRSVRLPAWLEVAKPRLIPLLLATTLGGMAVSGDWPVAGSTVACTLLGGSLASAAAGVLNCLWEQELDGRMQRTSRRALPSGRLAERQAFALAIALTATSVAVLVLGVNALAASLSLLGLCSYVLLYTALLKPRTTQNIVIGGVAGAIPPWWGWPPPAASWAGGAGGSSVW